MDDDLWKQDGTFRGTREAPSGKFRRNGGPEYTRIVPKFLQKFEQPPAIDAKIPKQEEEEDEEGLDEVQQAAVDEYLAKEKEKGERLATAAGADEDANEDAEKKKKSSQAVAGVGAGSKNKKQQPGKKRKRKDAVAVSNKKLLSFSMDDEDDLV